MLAYEITVQELAAKLGRSAAQANPAVKLIDVRESWEYEVAHIPGSTLIPMSEVPSRANNELDPDQHIAVICHAGVRSMSVTAWLREQGYDKVQSVRGGIDAWSRGIDPTVPRY